MHVMTDTRPIRIPPLAPRPEVLDFLRSRRSRPAKTLRAPGPDRAALAPILEAALRVPDHGKLEPWRLIVLEGAALARLAEVTGRRDGGSDPDKRAKAEATFRDAPLVVAVVAAPRPAKVPEGEQILSAGAVCMALVTAALAAGWGANWLTGWMATDRGWLEEALEVEAPDFVAGFVVLGTEGSVPPDRPRPDLAAKVEWRAA